MAAGAMGARTRFPAVTSKPCSACTHQPLPSKSLQELERKWYRHGNGFLFRGEGGSQAPCSGRCLLCRRSTGYTGIPLMLQSGEVAHTPAAPALDGPSQIPSVEAPVLANKYSRFGDEMGKEVG